MSDSLRCQGGANPSAQVDSLHNSGVGTLSGLAVALITYGAGQPAGWLSASLSATIAPAALTLSAITGSLAAGTYTATVYVIATLVLNSPQTVTVTFKVSPPLISLRLSNSIYVSAGSADTVVTDSVTNGGGGTLTGLAVGAINYKAGQPTGWLSASLTGAPGFELGTFWSQSASSIRAPRAPSGARRARHADASSGERVSRAALTARTTQAQSRSTIV